MIKALVAIDGSQCARRAAEHVAALVKGSVPMEVHLLNVQLPIETWEVRSHSPDAELVRWQLTRGQEALASAKAILDGAKMRYTDHVLVGDVARTITDFARDHGCDQIIMGTRGMTAIANLMIGSISTKVIHLSEVPITLVK